MSASVERNEIIEIPCPNSKVQSLSYDPEKRIFRFQFRDDAGTGAKMLGNAIHNMVVMSEEANPVLDKSGMRLFNSAGGNKETACTIISLNHAAPEWQRHAVVSILRTAFNNGALVEADMPDVGAALGLDAEEVSALVAPPKGRSI